MYPFKDVYTVIRMLIWCEVQPFEELVDVKFTSFVSNEEEGNEEGNGGKSEPLATIFQHWRAMIV